MLGLWGLDGEKGDSISYRLFDYFLPFRNRTHAENIFGCCWSEIFEADQRL